MIAAWIFLIIGLSFQERRQLGSRRLSLFRALFPSWRFFDRLEHVPKIFVRMHSGDGNWSEWTPLFQRWSRSVVNLFFNPQGNLEFAFHSLTEQLISDLNEADLTKKKEQDFSETVSCRLAERMVRLMVTERFSSQVDQGAKSEFQFKISVIETTSQQAIGDVLLSVPYLIAPGSSAREKEGVGS